MKRNNEFILKEIGNKYVLVPFGDKAIDFNGIITLNGTAKFLWENCGEEEIDLKSLKDKLISEYSIDNETATQSVDLFIEQLKESGCIDD